MEPTSPPVEPPAPLESTQPALPRDLRFDTSPYVPDGGFNIGGLVLLLLGLAIAGIIMGVVTHYISQWFYLILIFPFVNGVVIGFAGAGLVKAGRIRAPWLAGVAGLLAGILAVTMNHYMNYRAFLNNGDLQEREQLRKLLKEQPALAQVRLAMFLPDQRELAKKEALVESFFDFVDYSAHVGVSIKRAIGGRRKGLNIGYYGTYLYWGIETLIVAALVFTMTRTPAREPFCTLTNEWKTERCGTNFGVPPELGTEAVADALANGELGKIAEVKAIGAVNPESDIPVRLYVYASPQHNELCSLDVRLSKFVPVKNNMEEKEVTTVTYSASALEALEKLCGKGA